MCLSSMRRRPLICLPQAHFLSCSGHLNWQTSSYRLIVVSLGLNCLFPFLFLNLYTQGRTYIDTTNTSWNIAALSSNKTSQRFIVPGEGTLSGLIKKALSCTVSCLPLGTLHHHYLFVCCFVVIKALSFSQVEDSTAASELSVT